MTALEPLNEPPIRGVADLLLEHRHFAVVAHPRMDADAIGSILAFTESLRAAGCEAQPLSQGPWPANLNFLPGADQVIEWTGKNVWPHDWKPDVLIVCDIGSLTRVENFIGSFCKLYDHAYEHDITAQLPFRIVNVDHHPSNEGFGDAAWVRAAASSTAEMAWDVLKVAGLPINDRVAWSVYAGIMADTGSFNYSNTSPRAMRIAANMIEAGADPDVISREHYRTKPIGELKLHALILDRLQRTEDGRLAWSYVEIDDFERLGISRESTSDLVNLVTQLDSAQVAILFTGQQDTGGPVTRISFRGKGYHDLNVIAHNWGGGGHTRAAGATARGDLHTVMPEVVQLLTEKVRGNFDQRY